MSKASSDKGLRTKNRILEIARQEFYEKGFAKSSVKEICEKVGIRTGTFAYYFKTKEDLLREIYSNLHLQTYAFVNSYTQGLKINSIEKNVYHYYLYFYSVLKDKKTTEFHADTLRRESINRLLGHNYRHVYRQFAKDIGLSITAEELRKLSLADLGVRREVILDFIENPKEGSTIDDLIHDIYIFRSRLFKIEESAMEVYLENGKNFKNSFDHSKILFLI